MPIDLGGSERLAEEGYFEGRIGFDYKAEDRSLGNTWQEQTRVGVRLGDP